MSFVRRKIPNLQCYFQKDLEQQEIWGVYPDERFE